MPVVTHLVSLAQAAGVEAHFSEFVRHARASHPEFAHGWLNAARDMHPGLTPHEQLPADTRLWAALQRASGGTWSGCVYDVDRIVAALETGSDPISKP